MIWYEKYYSQCSSINRKSYSISKDFTVGYDFLFKFIPGRCAVRCDKMQDIFMNNLKHNWKQSMTASFAYLWSRYQIDSLILNCLFVIGFFVNFFGCINKDNQLFCHFFEYFDFQTKICFGRSKLRKLKWYLGYFSSSLCTVKPVQTSSMNH